jgi:general L-amino acid transport system permease protein
MTRPLPLPPLPPATKPLKWLQQNLFDSWMNGLLTVVCLGFMIQGLTSLIQWLVTVADWAVVGANVRLFFIGRYPVAQAGRIWAALAVIGACLVLGFVKFKTPDPKLKTFLSRLLLILLPVSALGIFWLINGDVVRTRTPILRFVPTNLWGGLMLTLFVSAVSIGLAFPLGVALALARQSALPVVRWLSTLYIEIIRGLPLIGILFMAQVMLPLILPGQLRLDRLVRAIAGLVLFNAAYLAETVRGGLQAIPRGQVEAAKALGLNTIQTLGLIVLPQALRAVIPAIVGQFISLFKDTSLLSLFALIELTGIARSVLAQPQFLGRYAEVYLFIGLIYWTFCYAMSRLSRQLERQTP